MLEVGEIDLVDTPVERRGATPTHSPVTDLAAGWTENRSGAITPG